MLQISIAPLVCLFISILASPLYSMEESPSYPEFYEIDFQKDAVGFIFENGSRPGLPSDTPQMVYGVLSNKKIEIITDKAFKAKFQKAKMTTEFSINYYGDNTVKDQNGVGYKIKYTACTESTETDSICKKLAIEVDKKIINIDLETSKVCDGCRLIVMERWKDFLWMGFAFRGEYEPNGEGVHVLDIKKKKIIKTINSRTSLVTIIKKDPTKEIMWIAGNLGLHGYDSEFNLVHSCNIVYPFWEKNNKDQTIKKNYFNFSCDK